MGTRSATEAVAEQALRERADRKRRWGAGLLTVAALLWLYAMFELLTRDWPSAVTALALSAPFAVVGGMLFTIGTTTLRLREHEAALAVIRLRHR